MVGASVTDAPRAISVLPDVSGVDRCFTYLVPEGLDVTAGMVVRINLANRKVRAWVLEIDVDTPVGVECKPIEGVVSLALDEACLELANFASWRYVGRLRSFLLAGSPERNITERDLPIHSRRGAQPSVELDIHDLVGVATRELVRVGGGMLELPPNAQRLGVVVAFIAALQQRGEGGRDLLVIVPEHRDAQILSQRLSRLGYAYALLPDDFARAYVGGTVVIGTRNAIFGPVGDLGGILVIDAHAESYVDQRAPTWNAGVIAKERARKVGVPCLLTSPCPPLSLTANVEPATFSRPFARAHWPMIQVIDRRGDDPRSGLYAPVLAELIRRALAEDERPVACLLNRTGRIRLLACNSCGEIVRCEHCGAPMRQQERADLGGPLLLTCSHCARTRPLVCAICHSGVLKSLRVGASRAAEELGSLVGVPTELMTGQYTRNGHVASTHDETNASMQAKARVVVGTEAILHRLRAASLVIFLDFDQHLLAPRFGVAEEALALISLAGRLVGARSSHLGHDFARRIVLQSRLPNHEVIAAALAGDPSLVRVPELARRGELKLPPFSSIALVSGESAPALIESLSEEDELETAPFDEIPATKKRPSSQRYLVRASDTETLCGAFARVGAVHPGVRIEVDPTNL